MAKFIGTKQEFLDLFGSTVLTNAVKSYINKNTMGENCAMCGEKKELQRAHRKDKPQRMDIAKSILEEFTDENGLVTVDMHQFLEKFYDQHKNISEHFIFLCDECHKKYDSDMCSNRRKPGESLFSGWGKPQKATNC